MSEILTGWIPFDERTDEQNEIHDGIVAKMPAFSLPSMGTPEKGTKLQLTQLWRHPLVVKLFGFAYPGIHQLTGSCVWAAGEVALQTLVFVETLMKNEPEKMIQVFALLNYGMSRKRGGMRGRGEGSFGSTFAESCIEDGAGDVRIEKLNLPKPKNDGMLVWTRDTEFTWSDGNHASDDVRQESKLHPIKSAAQLPGFESVRDSILNGYPVTRAFSTFVNPGTARVKDGALIGSYNGRGGHQESWLDYWHHPNLGELIWEQNQWGHTIYGADPGGGPGGGCWIQAEEVDRQCKRGEIYAFSQYDGYPAQPKVMDWATQSFFS